MSNEKLISTELVDAIEAQKNPMVHVRQEDNHIEVNFGKFHYHVDIYDVKNDKDFMEKFHEEVKSFNKEEFTKQQIVFMQDAEKSAERSQLIDSALKKCDDTITKAVEHPKEAEAQTSRHHGIHF